MATFIDVINSVLYRIDEDVTDTDEEILKVIKDGINEGYSIISSNIDQHTKDISFSYTKGYALPTDFVDVANLEHSQVGDLARKDYEIKANLLYIRAKDAQNNSLTLKYIYLPTVLINDSDTINLKSSNIQALIVYASYTYYVYRKKVDIANMFLNEFMMLTGLKVGGNNEA